MSDLLPDNPPDSSGEPSENTPARSGQDEIGKEALITPTFDADGRLAPGRHRMEVVYIVLSSFRILVGFLFALVVGYGSIVAAITKSGVTKVLPITIVFIALVILLIAIVVIGLTIYYKRFSWELTATDIHIRSGIIVKKQDTYPVLKSTIHRLHGSSSGSFVGRCQSKGRNRWWGD